jgi:hypothetical protein
MADEVNPVLSDWELQQQAEQDEAQRRIANIHLEEAEKRLAKKKASDLGSMTDEELRRYTRKLAGYDAI